MNLDRLSSELIRSLRGRRSQNGFSRRLGYSTNVVHTWEAGRRHPSASDFFRAAARSSVDVGAGMARFFRGEEDHRLSRSASDQFVTDLMRILRGDFRIAELAGSVGATRLTVSRWLRGETEPRLPDLLGFVKATTQRLLDFVAVFADPASLASTRAAWRDLQAQLRVAYDVPWSHAVLRALELADYRRLSRHEPGFIARRLGISLQIENDAIDALAAAGQIRRVRGKWTTGRVLTVDTRPDPDKNLALKRHWAQVGVERLGGEGLFSYNLFSISEEHYARLQALHRAYFEQLRAIVAESRRSERVVLANVQLFSLAR
jgi:transcriptional regulator with XRE-family HTH domain